MPVLRRRRAYLSGKRKSTGMFSFEFRNDVGFVEGSRWQYRNWEVGAAKAGVAPDANYHPKGVFLQFYGPKMDPR